MNTDFIIDSWRFKKGQAAYRAHDPAAWEPGGWYHCQRDLSGLEPWLDNIGLNPALIKALLAEDTRPRFQPLDDGNFLLIIRGVNLNQDEEPDDMLSLRILYYQGSLISLRKHPFKAIAHLHDSLSAGSGPRSLDELLLSIIDQLHQSIEDVVENTETEIDEIQERLDTISHSDQRRLTYLHRQLLKLNRFLKPQTTALSELLISDYAAKLKTAEKQMLHNQKDVILRILENIEAYLDQVWMLREHIQQALAEKMNRNTYWLSLIAGIFLPLSFVTGLLGVNVGGIPGAAAGYAFSILCLILAGVGLVEFLLLRRLKFW